MRIEALGNSIELPGPGLLVRVHEDGVEIKTGSQEHVIVFPETADWLFIRGSSGRVTGSLALGKLDPESSAEIQVHDVDGRIVSVQVVFDRAGELNPWIKRVIIDTYMDRVTEDA